MSTHQVKRVSILKHVTPVMVFFPPHRSDWVTSYKVMVSNDSHTWVTVKNGSGDMVSPLFPLYPCHWYLAMGLCPSLGRFTNFV